MTSSYALLDTAKLSVRFNLSKGLPKGVKPFQTIKPTTEAPVIIEQNGERYVELMKWGLIAKGAKDTNSVFRYKTYNVPSEKIFSKHSWETAVRTTRCLVPVNGFYGSSSYIHAADNSLLTLAGMYTRWEDSQHKTWGTFSILTTDAHNDILEASERMPLILATQDEARWLDASITDANAIYDMMRPSSNDLLSVDQQ